MSGPRNYAIMAFLVALASPVSALACTFYDFESAILGATFTAHLLWIASVLLLCVIICTDVYSQRISRSLVLGTALVIFHPRWLLDSVPGAFCRFTNVHASKIALFVLLTLVVIRLVKWGLGRRKLARP